MALSKGNGSYYTDPEKCRHVYHEASLSGVSPIILGSSSRGIVDRIAMTFWLGARDVLKRQPKNRHRMYEWTDTDHKSVSYFVALHGPARWKRLHEALARGTVAAVSGILNNQELREKGKRHPSTGEARVFCGVADARGAPHTHRHVPIRNVTRAVVKGKEVWGSIGNVRNGLYRNQALAKAISEKLKDDFLRQEGAKTKLVQGKYCAIDLGPNEKRILRAISPMARERKKVLKSLHSNTAASRTYAARKAHKVAGWSDAKRAQLKAEDIEQRAARVAAKYKAGLERLKSNPPPVFDPRAENELAHGLAREARDHLAKTKGVFKAEKFLARLLTQSIGKDVRFESVMAWGQAFLQDRHVSQMHKLSDGRYTTRAGEAELRADFKRLGTEAVAELKKLGGQLLGTTGTVLAAGLEASALTAKAVTAFLREVFKPKPPPHVVVDALSSKEVQAFFRKHTPMPYWRAQWKAFWKGVKEPGSPHERMARVENYLRQYRSYERIRKDATVVVKNYDAASLEVRRAFQKLNNRDGFILVPERRAERRAEQSNGPAHEQRQRHAQGRSRPGARARADRMNGAENTNGKRQDRYEH